MFLVMEGDRQSPEDPAAGHFKSRINPFLEERIEFTESLGGRGIKLVLLLHLTQNLVTTSQLFIKQF